MIMRQMLCLFGVSTLISLLVIMVFYSGDGFIEQVKQFISGIEMSNSHG